VIPETFRGRFSTKNFSRVRYFRHHEEAMNCQSCNTTIDYRFQTNCADCEIERVDLVAIDQFHESVESKNRNTWPRRGVNLVYLLTLSAAAMISGAVVLYFGVAITCAVFIRGSSTAIHNCAEGNRLAILSIWLGAFLGTVGGSAFAVKNPVCKY